MNSLQKDTPSFRSVAFGSGQSFCGGSGATRLIKCFALPTAYFIKPIARIFAQDTSGILLLFKKNYFLSEGAAKVKEAKERRLLGMANFFSRFVF